MSEATDNPQTAAPALPPVAALRVIRTILADGTMSAVQRSIAVAVVCQADGATGCAWASYRQLRRDYGFGLGQICQVLAADGGRAIGRFLEPVRRGARGAVCYRILADSASLSAIAAEALKLASATDAEALEAARAAEEIAKLDFSATGPEALDEGSATDAVALKLASATDAEALENASATDAEALENASATAPVAILAPTLTATPLTPRDAGGARERSAARRGKETAGEAAVLDAIEAAYPRAFRGEPMPGDWRRQLRRKLRNGSADYVRRIDAASLKNAKRWSARRDWAWGVGTVLRFLEGAAADGAAERPAAAPRMTLISTHVCQSCGNELNYYRDAAGKEHLRGVPCEHQEAEACANSQARL